MTGAVKEEILTRQAELGLFIQDGCLLFDTLLLNQGELLSEPTRFVYYDVADRRQEIKLDAGSLAYSICQVPIILQASNQAYIEVQPAQGDAQRIAGHVLDGENSRHIFARDGAVHHLKVFFKP